MLDPSPALARLVAHENSASDLLAFLFERNPEPLISLLGLPDGAYRCQREVKVASGRLDLAVCRRADDLVVAVLELKGASSEHGDQLDRYEAWAARHHPAPTLFLCTLDGDGYNPRGTWKMMGLVALFGAWETVDDPHTAWLAREVTAVLRSWDAEADGIIGKAHGRYVPDLVSRRTAHALDEALRRDHPGDGRASASRTSAGNPMIMARRCHPRGSDDTWIAVDIRCDGRAHPARHWLFRPCIDASSRDRSEEDARLEAHDLAVALRPAMLLPAVRQTLIQRERPDLAEALHANRHGGLSRSVDPTVLVRWRARLASGDRTAHGHPVFRHDGSRRLATQFKLDVTRVTRADLADLTLLVLDHLVEQAELCAPP